VAHSAPGGEWYDTRYVITLHRNAARFFQMLPCHAPGIPSKSGLLALAEFQQLFQDLSFIRRADIALGETLITIAKAMRV